MRFSILVSSMLLTVSGCLSSLPDKQTSTETTSSLFSQGLVERSFVQGDMEMYHAPQKARGLIINLVGESWFDPVESAGAGIDGAYISQLVKSEGYNLVRYDVRHIHRAPEFDRAMAQQLIDVVRKYKNREGYKKVFVGGNAYGGWIALQAAALDKEGVIDVALLTSFSKFGPSIYANGHKNSNYDDLLEETLKLAQDVRNVRMVVSCHQGDPWENADRCKKLGELFKKNGVAHTILDQPHWVKGHLAFSHKFLSNNFGGCLTDFLVREVSNSCELQVAKINSAQRHEQYESGALVLRYAKAPLKLTQKALKAYNEYYKKIPMIRNGAYNYKFFAVSPSTGQFGIYPYHFRNHAYTQSMQLCGQPDCVLYAEGNVVYPKH